MADVSSLYEKFYNIRLNQEELPRYNIPIQETDKVGVVKPYQDTHHYKPGCCKRCNKPFDISYRLIEPCLFHTSHSKKISGKQMPHECCGRQYGFIGCQRAPSHVHDGNVFTDLTEFRCTAPGKLKDDGGYGVYVIDTESVHTLKGLEVCSVIVLDTDCEIVYETYCMPTAPIIDYNTFWSGITKSDLDGTRKTFSQMQNDLLKGFNDRTVLVGHNISYDLIGVKLIHPVVVDTQALYPHLKGLPFRHSLKDLAETVLKTRMEYSGGKRKIEVDAEVAMKLALKKIETVGASEGKLLE